MPPGGGRKGEMKPIKLAPGHVHSQTDSSYCALADGMFWSDVADPAASPFAGHPEGPEQGEGIADRVFAQAAPPELPLTAGLCEQRGVRELWPGVTPGWLAAESE